MLDRGGLPRVRRDLGRLSIKLESSGRESNLKSRERCKSEDVGREECLMGVLK